MFTNHYKLKDDNMIINSCTLNIYFQKNGRIREKIFELENLLNDFQKPFTLVPMPADSPAELPRIIAVTAHGHTQMMISEKNVQMIISYDDNYNRSIDSCIEYMKRKCQSLQEILNIIGNYPNKGLYYVGISLQITLDDDNITNPIEYVNNKFLSIKTRLPIEETAIRFALMKDSKYYINLNINNTTLYDGQPDERGSFVGMAGKRNVLNVVMDVNDRYAFNNVQEYSSSLEEIDNIASIIEDIVKNKLNDFLVDGGIYND